MNRLYQVVFIVGIVAVAAGIGLGVYQSLATGVGLPPFYINYIDEIEGLIVEGQDYERVIEELRLAAKLDYYAKRPRHLFELAKASYRVNDHAAHREAINDLRVLINSGATADPRMYYYLAVAIMLQPDASHDEMTEALGLAAQAVNVEPEFGQAHLTLGQAFAILATSEPGHVNLSEAQQGEFHLRRAVELNPSDAEAKQALANIQQLLQAFREQSSP